MAVKFSSIRCVHLNCSSLASGPTDRSGLTSAELQGLERRDRFVESGRGYSIEHATRPSTIAHLVSSSPIALLSWVIFLAIFSQSFHTESLAQVGEKFLERSDDTPSLDEILTSVTLWWLTDTFPTPTAT